MPPNARVRARGWSTANHRRILLLLSQISYIVHLFSKDAVLVAAAANVASHFILNNLFVFAWILLWVRNHFWGSEVILAAHFINQNVNYWRNTRLPTFVHLPAVAGPYAWTLTALFWNGAVAVHSNGLAARIVANIFIWVILLIGAHAIIANQDYLLADCMSLLTLCKSPSPSGRMALTVVALAIKQFDIKIISLQWIFAFVIFALFVVGTFYTSTTRYYGRDSLFRRIVEPEATVDRERQPLLDEHAA